jgi:hypothetical protein
MLFTLQKDALLLIPFFRVFATHILLSINDPIEASGEIGARLVAASGKIAILLPAQP